MLVQRLLKRASVIISLVILLGLTVRCSSGAEPRPAAGASQALTADSPEEVFGDELIEYWDARQGRTLIGGQVSDWVGQVRGTTVSAPSSTERPNFATDGSNFSGQSVVQCAGGQSSLQVVLPNDLVTASTRPYLAFIGRMRTQKTTAAQAGLVGLNHTIPAGQIADSAIFLKVNAANQWEAYYRWTGLSPDHQSQQAQDTAVHLFEYVLGEYNGLSLYIDGRLVSDWLGAGQQMPNWVMQQPLAAGLNEIYMCPRQSEPADAQLSLAQVFLASAAPSPERRAALLGYARTTWGLSYCGDGNRTGSEQCDDGNLDERDACRNDCTIQPDTLNVPETVLGSDLVEYWDARSGRTLVNQKAAEWRGLLHGTAVFAPGPVGRPAYTADGTNFAGKPVIQTTHDSQRYLSAALQQPLLEAGTRPYLAVLSRLRSNSVPENGHTVDLESAGQGNMFLTTISSDGASGHRVYGQYRNGGWSTVQGSSNGTAMTWAELWIAADGLHYAENGVEFPVDGNGSQPLSEALTRLTVGGMFGPAQLLDSSIAQIIVARTAPTAAQRGALRDYARTAWGLAFCGDGYLQGSEQCDDANRNNDDVCRNDCTVSPNECAGVTSCSGGDGCCPSSCASDTDADCNNPFASIFGDKLLEYWDSRNGQTVVDGKLSDWAGRLHNTLVSAPQESARPTVAPDGSAFSGQPVVQCDGGQTYLRADLSTALIPAASHAYVAFVARLRSQVPSQAQATLLGLNHTVPSGQPADSGIAIKVNEAGQWEADYRYQTLTGVHQSQETQDTSVHLFEYVLDAIGGMNLYIDGRLVTDWLGSGSQLPNWVMQQPLAQGLNELYFCPTTTAGAQVSLAQVFLASAAPSIAQRDMLFAYIRSQWGVAYCGDGVVSGTEQCDDGNRDAADACGNDCTVQPEDLTVPKSLFGSSLVEYWDARGGRTMVGGNVAQWSGLLHRTTLLAPGPIGRPQYTPDGTYFAGKPVVQTAIDTHHFLGVELEQPLLQAGAQPYVAVIHRTRTSVSDLGRALQLESLDQSTIMSLTLTPGSAGSTRTMGQYRNGGWSSVSVEPSATAAVLSEIWLATDGLHYAYNGVEKPVDSTGNQPLASALRRMVVGGIAWDAQLSNSSVAEIIVADSAPSSLQRSALLEHARTAWGVTAEGRCGNECYSTPARLPESPIQLTATRDPSGSAQGASATSATPVPFTIPTRLRAASGNAGNGMATFTFTDTLGVQVTCTYQGGSTSASVQTDMDRALGRTLRLLSCSNGAHAGNQVVGQGWTLDVGGGDPEFGETKVALQFGPGCSGVLDPPLWPEDIVHIRETFDWTTTQALPETDSAGLPALYYVQIYLERPEQLEALKQLGVYFRSRPLFASELNRYRGKCGVLGAMGDKRGDVLFSLMPASLYNAIRNQALTTIAQGQGPMWFRALLTPPVPDAALTNPDGTLSWAKLTASGFAYFDEISSSYTPNPNANSSTPVVYLGGGGGGGGGVGGPFTIADHFEGLIQVGGALLTQAVADALIAFQRPPDDIFIRLKLRVLNTDTLFDRTQPMKRAWGPISSNGEENNLVPHGATVELTRLPSDPLDPVNFPAVTSDTIKPDGTVTLPTRRSLDLPNGALCVVLDNQAASLVSNSPKPQMDCDFSGSNSVDWDGFQHDIPLPTATEPAPILTLEVSSPELNMLTQLTDGHDYMSSVLPLEHPMRRAVVDTDVPAPLSASKEPFTACATFPGVRSQLENDLADLSFLASATVGVPVFLAGLIKVVPDLNYDIYLDRDDAEATSRGMTTHEYGHFAMCHLIDAGQPPSGLAQALPDLYEDRIREWREIYVPPTETASREHRVSIMMESFADHFAGQVASGVNYLDLKEDENAINSQVSYCVGPHSPEICLEQNARGFGDANMNNSYIDEITRQVTTYFDAFDRDDDDSRSVAGRPSNGDRWEKISSTNSLLVPALTGYMQSTDREHIELLSQALFEWIQNAIPRSCSSSDCAWTPASLASGLAMTLKNNGYSWCEACEMFALHDFEAGALFNRGPELWRRCRLGELAQILWSAPNTDPNVHLDANCLPCGPNQIVNASNTCVDCPPNRFPDHSTETCIACPADQVWDLSAEPHPGCAGLSVPNIHTIKAPNDICPDTFVLEVRGLTAIDSTSPVTSALQTYLTNYSILGDPICSENPMQWRGTLEFDKPSPASPSVVVQPFSQEVLGFMCPTNWCQPPCTCRDGVCANPTRNISTLSGDSFDNVDAFRVNVQTFDSEFYAPQLNIYTNDHCDTPGSIPE